LLVFMLVFFLAAASWALSHSSATDARNRAGRTTADTMSLAKEALIGRAASDNNRPGSLPCPDLNDDGVAELFSGSVCPGYLGRLPWKTLDLPELRDAQGEHLWYALAPKLRDDDSAQPINHQQTLELSLEGTANIAAIVLSPGAPLATQGARPSNTASSYLEGSNSNGDYAFVTGAATDLFNDEALALSRDDVFRAVNQRVLGEIRGPDDNALGAPTYGLRRYYANNAMFPWADSNGDGFADPGENSGSIPYKDLTMSTATLDWLTKNGWIALIGYQRTNASSVAISLGSSQMTVIPCQHSPCP